MTAVVVGAAAEEEEEEEEEVMAAVVVVVVIEAADTEVVSIGEGSRMAATAVAIDIIEDEAAIIKARCLLPVRGNCTNKEDARCVVF